jgi:hypothetical protein
MSLLTVTNRSRALFEVPRSPHAPKVELEPLDGTVAGEVEVSWIASDADGDELTADVSFSSDGGNTWQPVTVGHFGASVHVGTDYWPETEEGMIRVQVYDGLNTAVDTTGPFEVAPKAPVVSVLAPEAWSTLAPDRPVSLSATAYDAEDGPLNGDSISWTSDRDGRLGSGAQLSVSELSPGWHLLTATATDSSAQTAEDGVRIFVGSKLYVPSVAK